MSEACPACGTLNAEHALLCSLCSQVLRRVSAPQPALVVHKRWMEPVFSEKSGGYHLGVGLLLAGFFSLPFFLFKSIGWFFESLVHEMGHTLVSYALGSIALPALRLDGHAATLQLEPSVALQIVVWLLLMLGAGWFWLQRQRRLLITLAVCVGIYPLLAFSSAREALFLLGGHGGELGIATIFLWRSLIPSHKVLPEERTLYAGLGWYLWLQNLIMNWNLIHSDESRAWYAENGSFGLENDWIRLADSLGWSLEGTATVMLIAFLLAPPAGLLWARWSILHPSRENADPGSV